MTVPSTRHGVSRPDQEGELITLVLTGYNQEQFIVDAIKGALSQTYRPLEVILSDDCSSDRTFELMREYASAYEGPHCVRLNRNPRNLGVALHTQRLFQLASGNLVVMSQGDDVSKMHRVELIAENWVKCGRPSALQSAVQAIDVNGEAIVAVGNDSEEIYCQSPDLQSLRKMLTSQEPRKFLGAAAAYSKEVFTMFGPLCEDVYVEDLKYSFRALLCKGIVSIPDHLLFYRDHGASFTRAHYGRQMELAKGEKVAALRMKKQSKLWATFLDDISVASARGDITVSDAGELTRLINRQIVVFRCMSTWWSSSLLARILWNAPAIFLYGTAANRKWVIKRLVRVRYRNLGRAVNSV